MLGRAPGTRKQGAQGFTLIEVMLASLVFLLGLTAVFTVQNSATQTRMRAVRLTVARSIVANVENLVQVLAPAQIVVLTDGVPRTYDGAGQPTANGTQAVYTLTSSLQGQTNSLTKMRLHLEWQEPGKTNMRSLDADVQVRLP